MPKKKKAKKRPVRRIRRKIPPRPYVDISINATQWWRLYWDRLELMREEEKKDPIMLGNLVQSMIDYTVEVVKRQLREQLLPLLPKRMVDYWTRPRPPSNESPPPSRYST